MKTNVLACVFVLASFANDFCQAQWCSDGTSILPEIERRSRNNEADGIDENEPFIDDYFLNEGWYCVNNAIGQFFMPDNTTLPGFGTCGTYSPIYIRDTHPDPTTLTETPVTLIACQRSTFSECEFEYTIQVRRNNDEIQYYLVPTERYAAYCFDPPDLQNVTAVSARPTGVDVGTVSIEPELRFTQETIADGSNNVFPYLVFKCNFNVQPFFYTIFWYIDGTFYRQTGPSDNIADLELLESVLLADGKTLGLTLRCGVRASVDIFGIATTTVFSEDFFAGIRVLTPTLYLPKISQADIEFKPTVPVGCLYNDKFERPCELGLNMVDPSIHYSCEQPILIQNSRRCGADMRQTLKIGDTWDPEETFTITVKTTDFNFADTLTFNLHLKTNENYGHSIWEGVETDPVQVIVTDSETYQNKICYTHVDPHMKTFQEIHYEHHDVGEFIMYRNNLYDVEIQEKTDWCSSPGGVTCTCAIAVRAGKDVFMINRCGRINFIGFLSCEDGGILYVEQNDHNRYYVYTPTGTWIDILLLSYNRMLNVDITASPKDVGNVVGLCGTLGETNIFVDSNGVSSSSATPAFKNSWSLQSQDSLFVRVNTDEFDAWVDRNGLFCVCEQSVDPPVGAQGFRTSIALCSPTQYLNCTSQNTVTERKCSLVTSRKKRGFGSLHLETGRLLQLMATTRSVDANVQRQKRQVSFTEEIARENCTDIIMGSLVAEQYSDQLGSNDLQEYIRECTIDLVEGNDVQLAYVHVSAMNNQVGRRFEQDPEYVANNTDHVQHFRLNSCLNDCLGRGTCNIEGKCECFSPYYGADCGYDEADMIHVDYVDGGSTCDVASGDECRCFYIYTTQLVADFTCSITITTLDTEWKVISSDEITAAGDWYDAFSGICCLPLNRKRRAVTDVFASQLTVAVSNNGNDFGNGYVITSYDSTCQTATTDDENSTIIGMKDGHCFLDGQCFTHGEAQLSNTCYSCVSTASISNWTYVCESPEEPTTGNTNTVIIIVIVVVIVLFLGGILAYCVWRKLCRKTTKHSTSIGDIQANLQVKNPINEGICESPLGPSKDKFSMTRGLSNLSIHFEADGNFPKDNHETGKTSTHSW